LIGTIFKIFPYNCRLMTYNCFCFSLISQKTQHFAVEEVVNRQEDPYADSWVGEQMAQLSLRLERVLLN